MTSEPIYENADFSQTDESSGSKENSHDAHRQFLEEQLDWITVDHDDLRLELEEQLARPKYVPAMAVIDRWEKEMIERIRQTAVLARRRLVDALDRHVLQMKRNMDSLTPILRDARAGLRPFNEENIREWHARLQELNKTPDYSVIVDKRDEIHRLILDLREKQPTAQVYFPSEKSQSSALISIVHELLSTPPEKHMSRNLVDIRRDKPRGHIRFETHSDDSPQRPPRSVVLA